MIVLHASDACDQALSLRAKVSHTWLDHEVMMVPADQALLRWQRSGWLGVQHRWRTLHRMALELAEHLDDFSAARLVDRLPALAALAPALRDEMTIQLQEMHRTRFNTPLVKAAYLTRLQALWDSSIHFFELANGPHDSALADEFVARWHAVRANASSLRAMFASGEIPKGMLLP